MKARALLALALFGAPLGAPLGASLGAQQGEGRPANRGAAQATQAPQRNDDLQPAQLPPLPPGMSLDLIVAGDALFHGRAGCFVCHGTEAQGMPAAGDALTVGLSYIPPRWPSIDSLVRAGMPDVLSRSPIAMPARGARGDLTDAEVARVAAYVWAVSQTRGEPWPGGHASHTSVARADAAASGTSGVVRRPAEHVPTRQEPRRQEPRRQERTP